MIDALLSGDFVTVLLCIPIVLLALSCHECAHGYAAYKMGDPTARNFGRLTLNPAKHLDLYGTLCMLLFGFGWAKPVPVNARNFDKPRKGMAITAIAGPISNLILSFIGLALYNALYVTVILNVNKIYASTDFVVTLIQVVLQFLYLFHYLNLSLAIFNLIPVPPLDGSRIAFIFLPDRLYFKIMRYEQIIQIIVMVALFSGLLDTPLSFIVGNISGGMQYLIDLVIGLIL